MEVFHVAIVGLTTFERLREPLIYGFSIKIRKWDMEKMIL